MPRIHVQPIELTYPRFWPKTHAAAASFTAAQIDLKAASTVK
jgi:hypothetical protein